jgi:hypothetical protein
LNNESNFFKARGLAIPNSLESNHFKINLSILAVKATFRQPFWPLGVLFGKSKDGFVKLKSNFPAF